MSETAYDESYYDAMVEKTRYLFKLMARNTENPFPAITAYMESGYRQNMDKGNPLFLNKTPKQILEELGIPVKNQFEISEDYDESILV